MTNKEKRRAGILYDANNDMGLLQEMKDCKKICALFNQNGDANVLRSIFGKANGEYNILPSFWCDYGYNIEIGNGFWANHNLVILDEAKVTFGNNVFIGPNCGFYTASHPFDALLRKQGYEYAKPITVGNNVWFGGNVVVLSGVTIGNNVIIGAGSVVTSNIRDNVIAYGNPCRIVRENNEVGK